MENFDWNQILSLPNMFKISSANGYLAVKTPFQHCFKFLIINWNHKDKALSIWETDNILFPKYIFLNSNMYLFVNSNSEGYRLLFKISVLKQKKLTINVIKKDEFIKTPQILLE